MAIRAPRGTNMQKKNLLSTLYIKTTYLSSSCQILLQSVDEKWKTFCFCTGEEILRKRFANPGICWQKSCAYATAAVTRCLYEDTIWNYQNEIKAVSFQMIFSKKKVLTIFVNIYLSLTLLNLWHLNTNPTLPLEFKLRKKLEMFRSYIDFCGIHFCGGKVSPGLILWSPDSLNYKLGTTPTPLNRFILGHRSQQMEPSFTEKPSLKSEKMLFPVLLPLLLVSNTEKWQQLRSRTPLDLNTPDTIFVTIFHKGSFGRTIQIYKTWELGLACQGFWLCKVTGTV